MKRIIVFLVALSALLLSVSCAPAPSAPSDEDTRAASIVRLCEHTGLSLERADELLEILRVLGYAGEVLFAYPATDTEGMDYYHIWVGERTVDAYLAEDGRVISIRQSGVVLYGDDVNQAEEPSAQSPEHETSAPNEPKNETNEPKGKADEQEPVDPSAEDDGQQMTSEQEPTEQDSPDEMIEQPPADMTLRLDDMTEQITAGNIAYVWAHGRAGEEYRIEVHLKSGLSTAKGLETQTAGTDGGLLWEWKVSARTTPGDYHIRIVRLSDERDAIELPFSILAKSGE